jgi:tetratricopeptide (TPR) repeat protein
MVHWMYLSGRLDALSGLQREYAQQLLTRNCDAWTAYRMGELLTMKNDHAAAMPYWQRAVELVPGSSDFVLKLAVNEHRLSRRESAMRRLQALITKDPDFVPAYTSLGYMHLEIGQPQKAEWCYNKALRLDPDHIPTLLNRIGLRIHQGQNREAQVLIQQMLEQYPGDPRVLALQKQISR